MFERAHAVELRTSNIELSTEREHELRTEHAEG
jgi:hypothetical protein